MPKKGNRRLRLDARVKSLWLKEPKEVRARKVISDFRTAQAQEKTQAEVRSSRQRILRMKYIGDRIVEKVA